MPAEKPYLCPITDVRLVAKDRLDEFKPGLATYEQVSPPEGTEPDWILLYSKDFNSTPVRVLYVANAKPSLGYAPFYEGTREDRETWESISSLYTFTEYDLLERAGVWAQYEALPEK